ncbi:MAG: amino acid ABC transporter substrate-binding protein [Proteobacteria bacterium]|nr:amino acid ABC transporter substrate-binding protein [Pseudomonadota bacterium]
MKVRVSDWPPLYYQDSNNNWTGVDVELARALVTAAGFQPKFYPQSWARGQESIKRGDIHLVPGMGIKEERKDFALWVGPMRKVTVVLIVKKGNESLPIRSLDDMVAVCKKQKKKFGQNRKAFWSKAFNTRLENDPAFAKCFEVTPKSDLIFRKTNEGRILGFFYELIGAKYNIKTDKNYQGLAVHPFVLDSRSSFFGISKKGVDAPTLYKLYDAHEQLLLDGTLRRIQRNWE